jgi:PTH2 family peptidyl-tRNA hydrolase
MAPREWKMVIVARRDLKLSAGKLAAQVGHASVLCALKAQKHTPDVFRAWTESGQKKVVLRSDTLDDLYALKSTAEKAGLSTALVEDAGYTELPPGTITCLGIGPGSETDVDRVSGHLSLY